MATKQYEYFGNQSPLLNARYNRGKVYGQDLSNQASLQKNWNNDPWFTLGSTIGQAWADRYNERGIQKGKNEMYEALGQFAKDQGAAPQAEQPKQEIGPLGQTVAPKAENLTSDLADGNIGGALNKMGIGIPDARTQMALDKREYRLNKYANSDNPVSEAIQNKNDLQQMNQLGNNIDFSKLNKDEARRYVENYLQGKGRTATQIEAVLGQFDGMYDAKERKWGETNATEWMKQGAEAAAKGDFTRAQQLYAQASKWRPDEAKIGLSDALYQRNLKDKLAAEDRAEQRAIRAQERQFAHAERLNNARIAAANARAAAKGASTPGGAGDPFAGFYETDRFGLLKPKKFKLGGSGYSNEEYNNALKTINSANASDASKRSAQRIVDTYLGDLNSGAAREFTMTNPIEQLNALQFIDNMDLTPKGKLQYAIDHGVNVGPMFNQFVTRLGWNDPRNDLVYDDNPNHY